MLQDYEAVSKKNIHGEGMAYAKALRQKCAEANRETGMAGVE
jgi:hypothetical protein